jgi:hypothetical protein
LPGRNPITHASATSACRRSWRRADHSSIFGSAAM